MKSHFDTISSVEMQPLHNSCNSTHYISNHDSVIYWLLQLLYETSIFLTRQFTKAAKLKKIVIQTSLTLNIVKPHSRMHSTSFEHQTMKMLSRLALRPS